jgi:hypothetical protein
MGGVSLLLSWEKQLLFLDEVKEMRNVISKCWPICQVDTVFVVVAAVAVVVVASVAAVVKLIRYLMLLLLMLLCDLSS